MQTHWIDNLAVPGNGPAIDILNPATEERIDTIPRGQTNSALQVVSTRPNSLNFRGKSIVLLCHHGSRCSIIYHQFHGICDGTRLNGGFRYHQNRGLGWH